MRSIDADTLMDKLLYMWGSEDNAYKDLESLFERPADVTTCSECKYWLYEYEDEGLCVVDVPDIDGIKRLADDFCSGERR